MEDVLQRLLKAESEAEAIAGEANAQRERMVEQALEEARAAEERFEARVPSLRASFIDKAEAQAETTLVELTRRYEERYTELREAAAAREQEAIDSVIEILLDPDRN